MTLNEFEKRMLILEAYQDECKGITRTFQEFLDGFFVMTLGDKLIESYIELIAEKVEDDSKWIEWFIYENEWGLKKYTAGFEGEMKPIANLRDLYDLIKDKRTEVKEVEE